MIDKISSYLSSLDAEPFKPIKELEVHQGIKTAIGETEEKASGEALYEILAFALHPRHEDKESEWGTHFGSMMSGPSDKPGEFWEFPSRTQITDTAIEYWSKRAIEVHHPVLKARYADVAFDLAKLANKKADYTLAQVAIDNILKICQQNLVEGIYQRLEIYRALKLSLKISDPERLNKVVTEIIEVEKRISIDDKPGTWGFAFNWLVLEESQKVQLDAEKTKTLLEGLESRLTNLIASEDPEPWNVECAITPLLTYYLRQKDDSNAKRVLESLEDAYRRNKRANSDPMLKVSYLEKLSGLYRQNSTLPGVKEHIARIARELPEASKESLSSYKEISTEIKIEQEKIDEFLAKIFEIPPATSSKIEVIRTRIVSQFLEHKAHAARLMEKIAKEFVFMHIVEQKRTSPEGHTECIIPPYEEDPESHIVNQAFQNIQLMHIFLSGVMQRFKKEFTVEEVALLFSDSGLMTDDELEYLKKALQAYWNDDYLSASQSFIPYIETLIRRFIGRAGGVTLSPNEFGGYKNKTLGALLADNAQIIDNVYQGEVSFYLKVVLTHPLGWNLRNNFAHGIALNSLFRQDIADRLFHILLLLSLIKVVKKESVQA